MPEEKTIALDFSLEVSDYASKASFISDGAGNQVFAWDQAVDKFDLHFASMPTNESTDELYQKTTLAPTSVLNSVRAKFNTTLPTAFVDNNSARMICTYPAGAISLSKDAGVYVAAKVKVAQNQPLSTSGLNASVVPMVSEPVRIISNSEFVGASQMSGKNLGLKVLGVPVELGLKNLPNKSGSDKIKLVNLSVKFFNGGCLWSNAATYDIDRKVLSFASSESVSPLNSSIDLSSEEGVAYGEDVKFYFTALANTNTCRSFTVVVETADQMRYTREVSISDASRYLGFKSGELTRFTVDMSSAKQEDMNAASAAKFAVEWSPGYLTFDADNLTYKFAGPRERGLYFKYNSTVGFDISGILMNSSTTITLMNSSTPWPKNPVTYYEPVSDMIMPTTSYTTYESIPSDNGDSCAYVGEGWRLPTLEDIDNLVQIGQSEDNPNPLKMYCYAGTVWNEYYPSPTVADTKNTKVLVYSDGEQTVELMMTGFINHNLKSDGSTNNIMYASWNYVSFWTSTMKDAKLAYCYVCTNLNSGVAANPGVIKPSNDHYANGIASYATAKETTAKRSANMVRCVRDKK